MLRRELRGFNVLSCVAVIVFALLIMSCNRAKDSASNSSAGASSASLSSGGNFEGTITMQMKGESEKVMEMTYFLKGQHTRIEVTAPDNPEAHSVMLWDLEGAKMTTLMPTRKMYMTIDMKEMAEKMKDAAKDMKKSDEDPRFPKLTDTGKQETIAGYTCEHWLMGEKQNLDICVAKGLGYFGMGGGSGGGLGALKDLAFSPKLLSEASAHPEWVKFLEGGAFPLKITATEKGKVTMNMEATKIERKSLDDSLFAVPPDYKELNMGNFTGGKQ